MTTTMRPMMNGARFAFAGPLYSSITAKMQATSSAVPITWSMNGPNQEVKYSAGKVAKIE